MPTNSFDYDMYLKYLESSKWSEIRNKRLAIDNYKCAICGNLESLQVHHLIYPNILGTEHISDLVTLCKRCHKAIENRKDSKKSKALSWYSNDIEIWVRFETEESFEDGKTDLLNHCNPEGSNPVVIFIEKSKSVTRPTCEMKVGDECWTERCTMDLSECKKLREEGFDVRLHFRKDRR